MNNLINSSTFVNVENNMMVTNNGISFRFIDTIDFNNKPIKIIQSNDLGKLIDMGLVEFRMTPVGGDYVAK